MSKQNYGGISIKIGKSILLISCLIMMIANPHTLESGINSTPTSVSFLKRAYLRLQGGVKTFAGDNTAVGNAILAGIMIMIIGFATLVIGNYIVFAIIASLPILTSASYNATLATITNYATTVLPLFGLGLMVLGFAVILYTLRSSMDTGTR